MAGPSPLDAALDLAARGWPTFPTAPGGNAALMNEWPAAPSTDPEQIRSWWRRWPEANVAIVTGRRSGVLALDVDGPAGERAYGHLLAEHGDPACSTTHPDGATVRTGREEGGWRMLLAIPPGVAVRKGRLAPGLEYMGDGGSAILPPSVHPTGRRYIWRDRPPPGPLPQARRWLLDLIEQASAPPRRTVAPLPPATMPRAGGGTPYGLAALNGELAELAQAEKGARNVTLNTVAFRVGSLAAAGHLDLEHAVPRITETALSLGLTEDEVRSTLTSGIKAGLANPRLERGAA